MAKHRMLFRVRCFVTGFGSCTETGMLLGVGVVTDRKERDHTPLKHACVDFQRICITAAWFCCYICSLRRVTRHTHKHTQHDCVHPTPTGVDTQRNNSLVPKKINKSEPARPRPRPNFSKPQISSINPTLPPLPPFVHKRRSVPSLSSFVCSHTLDGRFANTVLSHNASCDAAADVASCGGGRRRSWRAQLRSEWQRGIPLQVSSTSKLQTTICSSDRFHRHNVVRETPFLHRAGQRQPHLQRYRQL